VCKFIPAVARKRSCVGRLLNLKAFAYTATPVRPGQTGQRGFCGDSGGRLCVTPDGSEPPVKDGRCEPCKKL
jgi:hypothetical protein